PHPPHRVQRPGKSSTITIIREGQRPPDPLRQSRQSRPGHPPLPGPPPPHRHRRRLQRLARGHAHPRPRHPNRHPRRITPPTPHPRPHHRLPAHPLTPINPLYHVSTHRSSMSRDITVVPPAGFEPAHPAPEAGALSPELRGLAPQGGQAA